MEKLEKQLKVKVSLITDYEQKMKLQQNNVDSVYKQLSEAHKKLSDQKTQVQVSFERRKLCQNKFLRRFKAR